MNDTLSGFVSLSRLKKQKKNKYNDDECFDISM